MGSPKLIVEILRRRYNHLIKNGYYQTYYGLSQLVALFDVRYVLSLKDNDLLDNEIYNQLIIACQWMEVVPLTIATRASFTLKLLITAIQLLSETSMESTMLFKTSSESAMYWRCKKLVMDHHDLFTLLDTLSPESTRRLTFVYGYLHTKSAAYDIDNVQCIKLCVVTSITII
jgi:hypothetical protein